MYPSWAVGTLGISTLRPVPSVAIQEAARSRFQWSPSIGARMSAARSMKLTSVLIASGTLARPGRIGKLLLPCLGARALGVWQEASRLLLAPSARAFHTIIGTRPLGVRGAAGPAKRRCKAGPRTNRRPWVYCPTSDAARRELLGLAAPEFVLRKPLVDAQLGARHVSERGPERIVRIHRCTVLPQGRLEHERL
jgi:hypothetical protein